MRKLIITFLTSVIAITSVTAQTLFQFGNDKVSKDEFLKVYRKNSMNKQVDYSEPALREYLNLYSLFRMKVKEAQLQQIDTMASIQYELNNYRKTLAKNYLTDDAMNDKLMKEAYDRMKSEIHIAHILVYNTQFTQSADTMVFYKKIDSIYTAITKGKSDFAAMAMKYSDDGGSKANGGDIGYITALQTVYPFENAAYNTPVGKISKPFRTQFGYHILKVIDKRPASGQVKVAQIMFNTPKSKGDEGKALAKMRMDTIMTKLKAGEKFEDLASKYSEDKYSNKEGGVLNPISIGETAREFEAAAFGLKTPGDMTQVQTDYGLHLIKLMYKIPLKPFDSLRTSLKRKVENDSRAQVAKQAFMDRIKLNNGYKDYPANYEALASKIEKLPDTGKDANTFGEKEFSSMNNPVFDFAGKSYLQSDVMTYAYNLTRGRIIGPRKAVLKDIFTLYLNSILNDFEEHKLVEENPEFKGQMTDYTDGIMLFELMDRNVWRKASTDTTGLRAFYETKKNKYMWEPGFKGAVYNFKDETSMNAGKKLLANSVVKDEDVVKKLNTEAKPDAVSIQRGHYEFSKYKDFPQSELTKGKITSVKKNENGTYTFVKVDDVFSASTPKSLDEAKGYIVAEYQDYLEKTWHEALRTKYPVSVDESVFKQMVK